MVLITIRYAACSVYLIQDTTRLFIEAFGMVCTRNVRLCTGGATLRLGGETQLIDLYNLLFWT